MAPEVVTLGETMVCLTPDQRGLLRYARGFGLTIAGAESNVAVGLTRLGHAVAWISKVGQDEFGEYVKMRMRGEGVDVSYVLTDAEHPTGVMFKEQVFADRTNVHYYRNLSAASRLQPSDLDAELIRGARLLHLTGITPALSDSCQQTVFEAMRIAKEAGVLVSFDPNIRLKLWGDRARMQHILQELCAGADIVLIGHEETQMLYGTDDLTSLATTLHGQSVDTVVVKRGAEGAGASRGGEQLQMPAVPVMSVVDPIGAGDAFAAGFLAGRLRDLPLADCLHVGHTCGAMATQAPGDIEALPFLHQIDLLGGTGPQVER